MAAHTSSTVDVGINHQKCGFEMMTHKTLAVFTQCVLVTSKLYKNIL